MYSNPPPNTKDIGITSKQGYGLQIGWRKEGRLQQDGGWEATPKPVGVFGF
jgi:hypothetical protein